MTKFTCHVSRGFSYETVTPSSTLGVRLGIEPEGGTVVKSEYATGQIVEFQTLADYQAFIKIALKFKGEVRCVRLPEV